VLPERPVLAQRVQQVWPEQLGPVAVIPARLVPLVSLDLTVLREHRALLVLRVREPQEQRGRKVRLGLPAAVIPEQLGPRVSMVLRVPLALPVLRARREPLALLELRAQPALQEQLELLALLDLLDLRGWMDSKERRDSLVLRASKELPGPPELRGQLVPQELPEGQEPQARRDRKDWMV
jgi:hypothetical protein